MLRINRTKYLGYHVELSTAHSQRLLVKEGRVRSVAQCTARGSGQSDPLRLSPESTCIVHFIGVAAESACEAAQLRVCIDACPTGSHPVALVPSVQEPVAALLGDDRVLIVAAILERCRMLSGSPYVDLFPRVKS